MHKKVLLALAAASACATILGILAVLRGDFSGHSYLFFPLGIFVWGDALIIGPFLTILSLFLYHKNKKIYTGLALTLYASARSFIEILYGLNAQFTSQHRPWELEYLKLAATFGVTSVELHMLYQILSTCIFVVSSLLFLHFLRIYLRLKR